MKPALTEAMVEAGCRKVYGKSWDGPPDKAPSEKMKAVWRDYARRFWDGFMEEYQRPPIERGG